MKNELLEESHLTYAHKVWLEGVKVGDIAIDATAGNGHDALFLAQAILSETAGELHCIDVQKEAIDATRHRLKENLSPEAFARATFHHTSHATLPYCRPQLIVYNLGYLPGSDKSLTTKVATTLQSVKNAFDILAEGGLISITCYPGHPEGKRRAKHCFSFQVIFAMLRLSVQIVKRPHS